MGLRGKIPEPTALRILKGKGGKPLEKCEPKPKIGTPERPEWVDGEARKCWDQLVPQLHEVGVLTVIDGNALARYCATWVRWKDAERFLAENGPTCTGPDSDGVTKKYPENDIFDKLAVQLTTLEREFGLTPSARTRIRTEPIEDTSEFDEFLAKGKRKA